MSKVRQATILITGGKYTRIPCWAKGDGDMMSGAKQMPVSDSYTGGTYIIVSPNDVFSPDCVLTSDDGVSKDNNLKETSTENSKRISREELLVNLVTEIMSEVGDILQEGELDSIIDRSKKIGAINEHLNSIDGLFDNLGKCLDTEFERLEAMRVRF